MGNLKKQESELSILLIGIKMKVIFGEIPGIMLL